MARIGIYFISRNPGYEVNPGPGCHGKKIGPEIHPDRSKNVMVSPEKKDFCFVLKNSSTFVRNFSKMTNHNLASNPVTVQDNNKHLMHLVLFDIP